MFAGCQPAIVGAQAGAAYLFAMTDLPDDQRRFDIFALARELPAQADTMLADTYLTDRPSSSARIFRVYRPVPAHFHQTCDEYLYVVSGRGAFWIGDESDHQDFAPGQLICFDRETVHAIPELHEEPVVFMSVDAPRREPTDITFIDPEAGSAGDFMARNAGT